MSHYTFVNYALDIFYNYHKDCYSGTFEILERLSRLLCIEIILYTLGRHGGVLIPWSTPFDDSLPVHPPAVHRPYEGHWSYWILADVGPSSLVGIPEPSPPPPTYTHTGLYTHTAACCMLWIKKLVTSLVQREDIITPLRFLFKSQAVSQSISSICYNILNIAGLLIFWWVEIKGN